MSAATGFPRRDQIAELTRGVSSLPLPALSDGRLQFVAEFLERAVADLRTTHHRTFRHGDETEITSLIESRLKSLRDEDQRWEEMVSNVVRGSESLSFDGRRLEVRPDLSIILTDRPRERFPLRVECKLIDHPARRTTGDYCRHGITRYEVGDYAWANREAFMLAYVRDGSDLMACLAARVPGLSCRPRRRDLAISDHNRAFNLLPPFGNPGVIKLWHLWLTV